MPQLGLAPEDMYDQTRKMDFQTMMTGQPAQMGVPPGPPANMSVAQILQLGQQGMAQPVAAQPAAAAGGYPGPDQPGVAQDPNAPPPGIAAPLSPITGMPQGAGTYNTALGTYTDASARQGAAMDAYTGAVGMEQQGIQAEGLANQELAQVHADKGAAMQGIDIEREGVADSYATKRQQLMEDFDRTNALQQRKMQQAVDSAGEASIHNFWSDKTTGARILGVIAQALSGAANGLAGNPSAPTPLDRIINDDLQTQIANQQNKRQVAQQQQSIYDTMLRATGNRLDAETALFQAANNRVTTMAQTLADKMATPEAAAMAKQFAAQAAQKNAQAMQKRAEMQMRIASQEALSSQGTMGSAEALSAVAGGKAAATAGKAGHSEDEWVPLPGMLNGVPKKGQAMGNYTRVSKEAEAITGYLHLMADARRALEKGGFDGYYTFIAQHGVATNLMRNATGAGANLTGQEAPINDSFSPNWIKTNIFGDVLAARKMLEANEDAWGGILLNKYASLNPQGGIDKNAPDIGVVLQRVASRRAMAQAKQAQQPQQPQQGAANGYPAP